MAPPLREGTEGEDKWRNLLLLMKLYRKLAFWRRPRFKFMSAHELISSFVWQESWQRGRRHFFRHEGVGSQWSRWPQGVLWEKGSHWGLWFRFCVLYRPADAHQCQHDDDYSSPDLPLGWSLGRWIFSSWRQRSSHPGFVLGSDLCNLTKKTHGEVRLVGIPA